MTRRRRKTLRLVQADDAPVGKQYELTRKKKSSQKLGRRFCDMEKRHIELYQYFGQAQNIMYRTY